jgi:hypothetical protein
MMPNWYQLQRPPITCRHQNHHQQRREHQATRGPLHLMPLVTGLRQVLHNPLANMSWLGVLNKP